MIKAAMVGLGWWGRTIVESVQSDSNIIRFVAVSLGMPGQSDTAYSVLVCGDWTMSVRYAFLPPVERTASMNVW